MQMLKALADLGMTSLPDSPHVMKRIWNYIVHVAEDNPLVFNGEEISCAPIRIAQGRSEEPRKPSLSSSHYIIP